MLVKAFAVLVIFVDGLAIVEVVVVDGVVVTAVSLAVIGNAVVVVKEPFIVVSFLSVGVVVVD